MWSDVGKKAEPRWLWHAIDHQRGTVLAYVFGRRKDVVFLQRQALLKPFGITRFYTDGWGAYARYIDPAQHYVGKENTQRIESGSCWIPGSWDLPMPYNPIVVTPSSLKPFFFKSLKKELCFLDNAGAEDLGIQ
jgi:IS1 family transposase